MSDRGLLRGRRAIVTGGASGIGLATARRFIAEEGYDPVYGARPLRRFIAHEVETRIGRALLGNDVLDGATIRVHLHHGALEVEYQNPAEPAREAA